MMRSQGFPSSSTAVAILTIGNIFGGLSPVTDQIPPERRMHTVSIVNGTMSGVLNFRTEGERHTVQTYRTSFAQRLHAYRESAIRSGMRLLDESEILLEVARRRGESS